MSREQQIMEPKTPDTPITQDLQEVPKENIERIERLPCGVSLRIQLMLVLLRAKPAITYTLSNHDGDPEQIVTTLRQTGLCAELKRKDNINRLIVAQKPETVEELLALQEEARQRRYSEAYYDRYGQLMGYPQTAIDAFIGRSPAFSEEESYRLDPDLVFSITFSREHWKEEVDAMRKWNDLVKEYAPKLYEEALQRKRITTKSSSQSTTSH